MYPEYNRHFGLSVDLTRDKDTKWSKKSKCVEFYTTKWEKGMKWAHFKKRQSSVCEDCLLVSFAVKDEGDERFVV